ncbi:hypothetical protein BDV06DRAFT_217788 [Aspergillus oleicola]
MEEALTPVSSDWRLAAGTFVSGVLLHQMIFRHGEWHLYALHIIVTYSALPIILLLCSENISSLAAGNILLSRSTIVRTTLCHLSGVSSSILIYRAFFHPLGRFPGPFLARLSAAYKVSLGQNLSLYMEVRKLHQQYGDIVRLGPGELSLASPAAVRKVHWPQATPRKGPLYDQGYPRVSLETTRDIQEHAQLRKIWDPAFNTRALRDYSHRVQKHATRLLEVFDRDLGQPINITRWLNYYSFDIMGDLAFGKSFDMLVDGRDHYLLSVMHDNMKAFALIGPLIWAFPLLVRIPFLNSASEHFWKFVGDQISWHIFHWILQGFGDRVHTKKGMMDLEAEAQLVIVAGSDTTASTLTNAIFELLSRPQQIDMLRAEFKQQINRDIAEIAPEDLVNLPNLNAVINETLRLHPPVLSGVQRKTPPGGMQLGETFIPEDTIIQIPFYTMFRDKRCFQHPNSFIPERWTDQPELIIDASVFVPFNKGTYSCVGKQLALMELRWVLTMVFTQYDIEFAPEHDSKAYLDGTMDGFTAVCAPLYVRLSRRESD